MKKQVKKFLSILLTILFIIPNFSMADVGDFESYDSSWDSSDWGGSDWGVDWDYDYEYDHNYGYDYGYGYYSDSDDGIGAVGFTIVFIIAIFLIAIAKGKNNSNKGGNLSERNISQYYPENNHRITYTRNQIRSESVADEIRKVDKYFNDEQFLAWTKNIFVKLQTAWSNRDWEVIRPIESENLFEQHSRQLQGYIDRKQINKMERICVNFAELVSFMQDNEKDILIVALNASMLDYIVDEQSGMVLKGSKDNRLTNTYKLTFTRKKGIITAEGTEKVKTTNCPNCGAPTTITSSGKCEFCGAVVTIGAHDWVLSDMERY